MKFQPKTAFASFIITITLFILVFLASRESHKEKKFTPVFEPGDCVAFTGVYTYNEPHFADKYIVGSVTDTSYQVFDPSDLNLDDPEFIRFSTAVEFKIVPCNGGVK